MRDSVQDRGQDSVRDSRHDNRPGGAAMIAGALMMLVTMAFHPTHGDLARDLAGQSAVALAVHALALCSVPIAFFGAWRLTRLLSPRSALAELALAFQGVACVAALLAATASGFLAPGLLARAATQDGAAQLATQAVLEFDGSLNQAFAKILVTASSVAIGLWSVAILRARLLSRAAGIYGALVAVATLGIVLSGHLRLDVHGFGAVVLAQAIWLIAIGVQLRRQPSG
jgi:hypothetical protein